MQKTQSNPLAAVSASKSNPLATLLASSEGKFVGITFIKEDGSIRFMNARTGVTKALKSANQTLKTPKKASKAAPSNVITVYDMHAKGYRSIVKDRILQVRMQGVQAELLKA